MGFSNMHEYVKIEKKKKEKEAKIEGKGGKKMQKWAKKNKKQHKIMNNARSEPMNAKSSPHYRISHIFLQLFVKCTHNFVCEVIEISPK